LKEKLLLFSDQDEIPIGALLSLTGSWVSLGESSKEALEYGITEINTYMEELGYSTRFKLYIEDSQTDPEIALQKLESLHSRDIKAVIGPQASSEVSACKEFVDDNDILLISHSSTAHSLAVEDDNIFRFCSDDQHEGQAVAQLMWEDGIRAIVPVWRNDAGNSGLHDATKANIESLGGTVYDGSMYAANAVDFSNDIAILKAQLTQAINQHGQEQVAVYLAAFDEVVTLFNQINCDSVLSSVRWYGSDGVALSEGLITNTQAAQFAVTVGYPNPIYGFDQDALDNYQPIVDVITAKIDRQPDAFTLAAYDALWVLARTYIDSEISDDFSIFKKAFVRNASSYFGATGWTILNEAGDRKYGNYDFWSIAETDGVFTWQLVASYQFEPGGTGQLIRFD
jgi:branched-chain amino acid transport system substrate-binding protein